MNNGPQHIGIIMDGNRRWAKKNGLKVILGHQKGIEALNDKILDRAIERGVKILTLYAFSTENWNRIQEVPGMMKLFEKYALKRKAELVEKGVQIRTMGDFERLPESLKQALTGLKEATQHNQQLIVNLCLSYDGRSEILKACQRLKEQDLEINQANFQAQLDSKDLADPELIIRTSGEQRLSGFLTWQSVYSELYFTPTLWSDFNESELDKAIDWYLERNRRFGK